MNPRVNVQVLLQQILPALQLIVPISQDKRHHLPVKLHNDKELSDGDTARRNRRAMERRGPPEHKGQNQPTRPHNMQCWQDKQKFVMQDTTGRQNKK